MVLRVAEANRLVREFDGFSGRFVYALVDTTGAPFYIGETSNPIQRWATHRRKLRVRDRGGKMVVLAVFETRTEALRLERWLYFVLLSARYPLDNGSIDPTLGEIYDFRKIALGISDEDLVDSETARRLAGIPRATWSKLVEFDAGPESVDGFSRVDDVTLWGLVGENRTRYGGS